MMNAFFQSIADFFSVLLIPLETLRFSEDKSWWGSNLINLLFLAICFSALLFWLKQLSIFDKSGEEDKDISSHSYL